MAHAPTKARPLRDGQATTTPKPESGFTGTNGLGRNETEQEMVANYIRPADFGTETTNSRQESDTGPPLEEPGSEAGPLYPPREAFFASYNVDETRNEVSMGTDERNPVPSPVPNPDPDLLPYPYRAICTLRITAADGSRWTGMGWLVGPRTVITVGHCVFLHNNGGWAKSIEVTPGLTGTVRPYGSATSSAFRSVKGWTVGKKQAYDYGAIILPADKRLGDTAGYFGYAVRDTDFLKSAVLNLLGYSVDGQWVVSFTAKDVLDRIITYDIGKSYSQSGTPLWIQIGQQRYCVGIHGSSLTNPNFAIRISQDVFDAIKNWKAEGA